MSIKRRFSLGVLAAGLLIAGLAMPVVHGDDNNNGQAAGQQGGGGQGGPGGQQGGQKQQGFHLIPRFAEQKMNLTDDQKTQVAALEKETKAKLEKILTADQMKTLVEARPTRPGQGGGQGGGGQGGPPGGN